MIAIGNRTSALMRPRHDVEKAKIIPVRAGCILDGTPQAVLTIKKRLVFGCIAMISFIGLSAFSPAFAGGGDGTFLVAQRAIAAPNGALGLCAKYRWACAPTAQAPMSQSGLMRLAAAVNTKVNRRTRAIADQTQYEREEYWTLPTARGGDCEDFALLKKKTLIEHGVASENLLIATVLDRRLGSHAVLVLRTPKGDVVLDNLNKDIRPWKKTGYTFLKLQNPAAQGRWDAVLAGGIIKERPTATR
jgi:predicted transglutaminase-like cysteine proteinase